MDAEVTGFQQQLFVIPLSSLTMGEKQLEPGKIYICSFPDCGASYNKSWKLEAHMCKHTGLKPFTCETEGCGKTFCTKYKRARHMVTHTGERPFRCMAEGCSEAFTTRANMKKHVARMHEHKARLYVCEYEGCGKVFKKNNKLKIHECDHTNLLPFQCTFEGCKMGFSFPSKLKRHEKVHQGYPCTESDCEFIGKTWTEYLKHRREEHKVQYHCSKCNKVLANSWNLQQHELTHEAARQVFSCPRVGCQRTYTKASNLQAHILSFHEECRPFACPHPSCTKTFALKSSLQQHSLMHDPEKTKLQAKERKPRPRRSLASRLSGFQPKRSGSAEPSKLAAMLQDASLGDSDRPEPGPIPPP